NLFAKTGPKFQKWEWSHILFSQSKSALAQLPAERLNICQKAVGHRCRFVERTLSDQCELNTSRPAWASEQFLNGLHQLGRYGASSKPSIRPVKGPADRLF